MRIARSAAVLGTAVLVAVGTVPAAFAGSSNGTTTTTATVTAPAVSVTAPSSIAFGTIVSGGAITQLTCAASGGLGVTDNSTAAPWSVSVTATDLMSGTTPLPFTALKLFPNGTGSTSAPGGCGTFPSAEAPVSYGTAATFGGTDTTPGTTQSSPLVLASENCGGSTGTACTASTWSPVSPVYGITVPPNQPPGNYTGTLVYTVTG